MFNIGWLIENGEKDKELRYLTIMNGYPGWTDDHNEAIRFARRIDAERFSKLCRGIRRIVEHTWYDEEPDNRTADG